MRQANKNQQKRSSKMSTQSTQSSQDQSNPIQVSVVPPVVYMAAFPPESSFRPQVFVCAEVVEYLAPRWPTATVSEQPVIFSAGQTRRVPSGSEAGHGAPVERAVVYITYSHVPDMFYPEVFAERDEAKRRYPDRYVMERPLLDMSHFAPVRLIVVGRSARMA
jgi:hypothetical protein